MSENPNRPCCKTMGVMAALQKFQITTTNNNQSQISNLKLRQPERIYRITLRRDRFDNRVTLLPCGIYDNGLTFLQRNLHNTVGRGSDGDVMICFELFDAAFQAAGLASEAFDANPLCLAITT